MRLKSKAPGVLAARAGADETICSAGNLTGFEADVNPKFNPYARGWLVTVRLRVRTNRWEYFVSVTNGITFVGFWGHPTTRNRLYAQLEAEFRGAAAALDWLRHVGHGTPVEVRFSQVAFTVFMGEAPCPHVLKGQLDRARRGYIAAADSVRIERDRCALVTREEAIAA